MVFVLIIKFSEIRHSDGILCTHLLFTAWSSRCGFFYRSTIFIKCVVLFSNYVKMNLFWIFIWILSPSSSKSCVDALNWCAAFFWILRLNQAKFGRSSRERHCCCAMALIAFFFFFWTAKTLIWMQLRSHAIRDVLMVSSIKMSFKFIGSSQRILHQLNNICTKKRRIEFGGVCASLHISRKAMPGYKGTQSISESSGIFSSSF